MAKKFGFGFMRLPLLDKEDQTSFDYATLNSLVDVFMERGFTYFDTALAYHNFRSEEALRKSVVERYPRNSFTVATKLPPRLLTSTEQQEMYFNEQLERCGVEYFDYYLVHNISLNSYQKACKFDTFGFVQRKKQEGKVKNMGMSFHDTPELLDEILTAHPELDFVQLQINYLDWENPGIQSRRCYEVARKHNLPVVVMEPCKGGNLAVVPDSALKELKAYNPDASAPSWAIRYAASLDGVMMVLSGMNAMDQVQDNTSYMQNFQPLNAEEYKVIEKVTDIINAETAIACTGCRYCVDGCPKKIAIPNYFALYNSVKRATSENNSSQALYYRNLCVTHGKADDCIQCGQCERACPQHLPVMEYLKEVAETFNAMRLPSEK